MKVERGSYVPMPPRDRNTVIAGFNGGRIDGLVVTRAGSTGLSLHASEKVADRRQRLMIEHQIPANVVERVQFWGRVNRRGQVNEPGFATLSTGLPMQARPLAMQNKKVADLSANVSGSADNATSMDVPDILDTIGNEIARALLEERPSLAERMCIAMKVDPEAADAGSTSSTRSCSGWSCSPRRSRMRSSPRCSTSTATASRRWRPSVGTPTDRASSTGDGASSNGRRSRVRTTGTGTCSGAPCSSRRSRPCARRSPSGGRTSRRPCTGQQAPRGARARVADLRPVRGRRPAPEGPAGEPAR